MQSLSWFGNPFVAGFLIPFFLALLTNRWKFLASPNDWTEESGFYGLDLLIATGGLQLIELATAIRERDHPAFLTLVWASIAVGVALLEVATWLRKHGYSKNHNCLDRKELTKHGKRVGNMLGAGVLAIAYVVDQHAAPLHDRYLEVTAAIARALS
jgi:hypothetical protein